MIFSVYENGFLKFSRRVFLVDENFLHRVGVDSRVIHASGMSQRGWREYLHLFRIKFKFCGGEFFQFSHIFNRASRVRGDEIVSKELPLPEFPVCTVKDRFELH
jgi:hypothetical protein